MQLIQRIILLLNLIHLIYAQTAPEIKSDNEVVPLKDAVRLCVKEEPICFSLQDYNTQVEFTIEYPKSYGWVSIGFGLWMASADMYIVWKNPDDSFTLSDRYGVGNFEPEVDKQQDLILNKNLTSIKEDKNIVVFRRNKMTDDKNDEMVTNSTTSFIWAYGKTSPKSNKIDATIELHDNFGKFELDMSTGKTASTDGGIKTIYNLIHGILLFLGWNLFPYFGILCAGPLKNKLGKIWFKLHIALLGVTSPIVVIIGVILAIVMNQSAHFSNVHEVLGIIVFILMFLQIILGVVIDRLWNPDRIQVPWYDKLHWYLGRILFLLAQINIAWGLIIWDPNFSNLIGIWVLFILILLAEIGFLVLLYVGPKYFKKLRLFLNPKKVESFMIKSDAF